MMISGMVSKEHFQRVKILSLLNINNYKYSYKLNFIIVEMQTPPEHNPMIQINRAQRTLDQIEFKLKSYKKQKNSIKKPIIKSDLPDLKEYLSYLISENEVEMEQSETRNQFNMTRHRQKNPMFKIQKKKTQKYEDHDVYQHHLIHEVPEIQIEDSFNLKKHTQHELQKEKQTNLQKIQIYYKQNCDLLDERIKQLQRTREKIKKDKILLMRDNEEIQKKLQKIRRDKENENEQNNPKSIVISEMMTEISSLRKKLNKIESENEKIRRKKKELQVNMRNCIKNNQEMVRADMSSKKMKNSKSKSMFTKCPYH